MPSKLEKTLAFGGEVTHRSGATTVRLKFKSTKQLARRVERMQNAVIRRQAQYVRKVAKNSIKKVGKKGNPSKAGSPPKSRTGALKQNLRYDYYPRRQVAYVGPIRLNKRIKDQPNTLEFGGRGRVVIRRENKGRARRRGRYRVFRGRATIKKRPTMALALKRSMPRFAQMYQGSL